MMMDQAGECTSTSTNGTLAVGATGLECSSWGSSKRWLCRIYSGPGIAKLGMHRKPFYVSIIFMSVLPFFGVGTVEDFRVVQSCVRTAWFGAILSCNQALLFESLASHASREQDQGSWRGRASWPSSSILGVSLTL